MPERTIETTVTFTHPFMLAPFDAAQPPGTYQVVIEEEEILGLSFAAYRRTSTVLHIPATGSASGLRQAFPIDPKELEAALESDARAFPTGCSRS
jgi:hypothetical protein